MRQVEEDVAVLAGAGEFGWSQFWDWVGTGEQAAALAGKCQDGAVAVELLKGLRQVSSNCESAHLALMGTVARSGVWQAAGALSPATFVAKEVGLVKDQALKDMRLVRVLPLMPRLQAAFEAGLVPRQAVDVIVRVGGRNRERLARLAEFDEVFTDIAVKSPEVLSTVLNHWGVQVDKEAVEGTEKSAHQRRYLRIFPEGDGYRVEGFVTADVAMVLHAAMAAIKEKHWRAGHQNSATTDPYPHATDDGHACVPGPDGTDSSESGAADHADCAGTDPVVPDPAEPDPVEPDRGLRADGGEVTSSARENADALEALAQLALTSGQLPATGGLAPNLAVLVPLASLVSDPHPDDLAATAGLPLGLRTPRVAPTNTFGSSPLTTAEAQRFACFASVRRIVIDPDSVPLDVGRKQRLHTPAQRLALAVRDQGCRFPGCERPPGWCEPHHIKSWADGGSTSIENGILLCSRHHHWIHANLKKVSITMINGKPSITITPIQRR